MSQSRSGVLAALAAFFLWGMLPLFWKQLSFLPPATIVAQRTLWSLLLVLPILWWRGEVRQMCTALRAPRAMAWQLLSGLLLSSNWLLYVWATLNGRILEGSLGYYLNPFFNMLFGALWFGERHTRPQLAAIGLALAGVALQIPALGRFPWVALTLALTFALYAVVRKRAPLGALAGLTAETALMAPFALTWLLAGSATPVAAFGSGPTQVLLVIGTGLVTAVPLLCFGHAARNLRLATIGILQFLGPTLQFFIGWKFYNEPMTPARLLSFSLIWLAVALYAANAMRVARQPA
ncbi:MAG: EamA family transporter RarD [Verrucomicrobia bacterium]|nr:EamA family transporter RarD [Verrucomicrobiota bacterium]